MNAISPDLKAYLPPSYFDKSGNLTVSDNDATKVATGIQAKAASLPPDEAKLFLAALASPSLAPTGGQLPANVDALIETFAAATDAIFNFVSTGDLESFLGRVMIKQSNEEETNALNERLSSRQTAKSELLDQASKMHDEASKMRTGAIISLVVAVVGAAISLGFSAASASKSTSAMGKMSGSSEESNVSPSGKTGGDSVGETGDVEAEITVTVAKGDNTTEVNILNSQAQNQQSVAGAINTLTGAISGATNSFFQADAKDIEAEGAKDAANAQEAQAVGDHQKEIQGALVALVDKIIQFLKDMQDSKAQQMQALTKV